MTKSGVCERAPAVVTVLFVDDDDDDARFAYKLIATDEGMLVLLARDGQEAIALANVEMPDVIVLDVGLRSMDGLDGFEVARRLRADQRTSTIPIVFLTGYNGARHLAAVVASGCEGHLQRFSMTRNERGCLSFAKRVNGGDHDRAVLAGPS